MYFLGKNPLDRNAVPNYGCLDILREFSEMPTLEIIPGYERGALKELFQKVDNKVDLSARELWHLVNRIFIKLGTGLYLACKENLACELACEEKVPCEADRTFAKATDCSILLSPPIMTAHLTPIAAPKDSNCWEIW